jgi:polyisoprenoid-binding protein YceI
MHDGRLRGGVVPGGASVSIGMSVAVMGTTDSTERYEIDARGSRLIISGVATGLLSAMGHNPVIAAREVTGEVCFSAETLTATDVRVRIRTATLMVTNTVSDKDRREIERTMKEDVLQTAQHPEVVFEGSKAAIDRSADGRLRAQLDGSLALHGVTQPLRVSAQIFALGESFRAQGSFEIRQTDFGIQPVSVAGGALKLKNELSCAFDLLVRKA